MLIAKIQNGNVVEVADHTNIFPNTSFGASGPNISFCNDNSCLPVNMFIPHDRDTQKLVPATPYIQNNEVFTVEVQDLSEEELATNARLKVPAHVSPRQIRQALTTLNLRAQVEAAVAAGDQDLKDWWEFSTQIERTHPKVIAMATGLNITNAQLNELFTLASTL